MDTINADQLKARLIDYLIESAGKANLLVGSEIMYGSENRFVDILALYSKKTVAFEIKSDLDSLERLKLQLQQYSEVFDYTYVLTTSKHYKKVLSMINQNTGVYVYKDGVIKIIKEAQQNRRNKKASILDSINTSSLMDYFYIPQHIKYADRIRGYIRTYNDLKKIKSIYRQYLRNKLYENHNLFIMERGNFTVSDDLPILSLYGKNVSDFKSSHLLSNKNTHSDRYPK